MGCDTDFEDPEEQSKDERKQSEAGWQKDANDVFTEAGPDKRIRMRVLQARHQQIHVYKMVQQMLSHLVALSCGSSAAKATDDFLCLVCYRCPVASLFSHSY